MLCIKGVVLNVPMWTSFIISSPRSPDPAGDVLYGIHVGHDHKGGVLQGDARQVWVGAIPGMDTNHIITKSTILQQLACLIIF